MKLIHCADIHLGSRIEAKLKDISEVKKQMVKNTFSRMIEYANENDIKHILLSGDVFDSNTPNQKDRKYFYDVIKNNPNIMFYYLHGNHDTVLKSVNEYDNLKTFNENWKTYPIGDVEISGIELTSNNALTFPSTLHLKKDKINIVMLHGQVSESMGEDKIKISSLKDKYIDYLALGHIHSYQTNKIDSRGIYCYSGCLEGRGFDEIGDKGFVLLEIEDKVKHTFIPFSESKIEEVDVDITDCDSIYLIENKCLSAIKNPKSVYRLNLVGEITPSITIIENDLISRLKSSCLLVNIKNKTEIKLDPEEYSDNLSLKGEFIRQVIADEAIDEQFKKKVISLGYRLLSGKEVDL